MSKYDKMLALNKKASEAKIELARRTIITMMDDGEKISIPRLMEKTGLSRGFFYKNPLVRREIDRALERQAGMKDPRRSVLDLAMDEELRKLQQQLESLKREKEALQKENEKLKKALGKKNINILKNF